MRMPTPSSLVADSRREFQPILHRSEPVHIPAFVVAGAFGVVGEAAVNQVDVGTLAFGVQFPAHQ